MKINWWQYWIGHCWMTGWQSIRSTIRIWQDLLSNNYEDYVLLPEDDPLTECLGWFWQSLGEDNTYPREFLEHLYQLCEDVRTGKEELIPFESFEDLMKEFE
mgnify:FL=1